MRRLLLLRRETAAKAASEYQIKVNSPKKLFTLVVRVAFLM
jgi:hypothetical protein